MRARSFVIVVMSLLSPAIVAACGASDTTDNASHAPDGDVPEAASVPPHDGGDAATNVRDASDADAGSDGGTLPACTWKKFSAGASASLRTEGGVLVFESPVPQNLTYVGRLDLDRVIVGDFEASIEVRDSKGGDGTGIELVLACAGTAATSRVYVSSGGKRALYAITKDNPPTSGELAAGVFRLEITRKGSSVASKIFRNGALAVSSTGTSTATQPCVLSLYGVTGAPPATYRVELDTFRGSGAAACADDFTDVRTY